MGIAGVGAMLLAASCSLTQDTITGSGNVVDRSFDVGSFTRLEVSQAFEVDVSLGEAPAVTVQVDDNLVDLLDVGVSGDTLRVGLEPNTSTRDAVLRAEVTATTLAGVEVSGAAAVHVVGELIAHALDVALSGAAMLEGEIQAESLELELSGASNATLTGRVADLTVRGSGASLLEAGGLEAVALEIELSGASSATVAVTDTLSASASGGSSLEYSGSPTVLHSDASGGSSITRL